MNLLGILHDVKRGDLSPEDANNLLQDELEKAEERAKLKGYADAVADMIARQTASGEVKE